MPGSGPILIVDDHRAVREELAFALQYDGWQTLEAGDGPGALELAQRHPEVALVLLDVKLPGLDGLEVLPRLLELRPGLPVVMISGHGDLDTAILAVKKGAYDFLQKPFANDRVLLSIKNALASAALHRENTDLRAALAADHELRGQSPAIAAVRSLIAKVAPTDAAVLVTGENGTGKELVARQLHAQSRRQRGPFVALNCAALPADLVESELFGHTQGAFTGATSAREGAFEQAHGGTLFLDEVGDMPLPIQAKLLRALQERTVQRLGAAKPIEVDVRIVAATNQDLVAMVAGKAFREDLYYRLLVVHLALPALRDRPGDAAFLAQHFLVQACTRHRLPKRTLAAEAVDWLAAQSWPGNVRQLRNVVEAAAILAEGPQVAAADLRQAAAPAGGQGAGASGGTDWFAFDKLEDFQAASEKEFLRRKLMENHGNIKRTAERIDLQRSNLYKKLERYGLK
ncbi:MAG: sigma-54-dependent Fis family transcriptional regulator [Planctomycetes bacterium]|nr:sigma-54-dependent Fis family transcriptional regulator [Planctomycetota bacterium]